MKELLCNYKTDQSSNDSIIKTSYIDRKAGVKCENERNMSDSLPISCVNSSPALIDTEKHNLNDSLNICSEGNASSDSFDENKKKIVDISDSDISLYGHKININAVKLKDVVINSNKDGEKDKTEKGNIGEDEFCGSEELIAINVDKYNSKISHSGEQSSNIAGEKVSWEHLVSRPHMGNGDFSENISNPTVVKRFLEKTFNHEVNTLQSVGAHSIDLENVCKSLNGLEVFSKKFEDPNYSNKGISSDNCIDLFDHDSNKESIKDQKSGNSYLKNFCKNALDFEHNSNLVDSEKGDENVTKMIISDSKFNSNVSRSNTSFHSGEIVENKLGNDPSQIRHLVGNDNCIFKVENLCSLHGDNECGCNCEKDINAMKTYNGDGLVGKDNFSCMEDKVGHSQLDNTKAQIAQIHIHACETDADMVNLAGGPSTVQSSENILCSKENIVQNFSTANVNSSTLCCLKDIVSNQNHYLCKEEISSFKNSTLECVDASKEETNSLENFCIICEKKVENLYYHAAIFHSCFAFVPVKYMMKYQKHLRERSPNIYETYQQSLPGDAMYICRKCGTLLKSIECVRIHLNIHSEIYASYHSCSDISCCQMNAMYKVQYITSLLMKSRYECVLCQQIMSCKFSLYNHLTVVHSKKPFCQKCSTVLTEEYDSFKSYSLHSSVPKEMEDVVKDCCHISWNVLYNSLNSLDGREFHLHLMGNSSDNRAFTFPIDINFLEIPLAGTNISPSNLMKKYLQSKFMWKRNLEAVSSYASLAFDVYIQIMLSKKLLSVRKKKLPCKKSQVFLASFDLKQLCRFSKRKSVAATISNDIKQSFKVHPIELSNDSSVDALNMETEEHNIERTDDIEISGEWTNTHTFMCCSCGIYFHCLTDIMDHKWLDHPGVWCAHTMLKGNDQIPLMFSQQYLPNINRKIVKEATLKELIPNGGRHVNVKCTKCKENILASDFCSHAVECGGLNQVTIKKKCRKTAKMQSHKGQRMSSRYTGPHRNLYKNMEEEIKMPSSDSSSRKARNKEIVNGRVSVVNSKVNRKKVFPIKHQKIKTISKQKKKIFNMKLRCAISKKRVNCVKSIAPKVLRKKVNVPIHPPKVHRKQLVKKIIKAKSFSKDDKYVKAVNKTTVMKSKQHKRVKNSYAKTLNICKGKTEDLEEDNKCVSKSISKIKQQKLQCLLDKKVSDCEYDVSDDEVKSNNKNNRREGLRARQEKVKETRYSLRIKIDKCEIDSNKIGAIEPSEMSIANESVPAKSQKDTLNLSGVKESADLNTVKSKSVKDYFNGIQDTAAANVVQDSPKVSSVKESIKVSSAIELLGSNTANTIESVQIKSISKKELIQGINRKILTTSLTKVAVTPRIVKELFKTQFATSVQKDVKEPVKRKCVKSVKAKSVKKSIKTEKAKDKTVQAKVANSLTKVTTLDKTENTANKLRCKKRKYNLVEKCELEESFGFPPKKRKYNIEDESDTIICHVRKGKMKASHKMKSKKKSKVNRIRKSSFTNFLTIFKEKSRNLKKLSRSRKFSDFKILYKLTKQKILRKTANCGNVDTIFMQSHLYESTENIKAKLFEKDVTNESNKINCNTTEYLDLPKKVSNKGVPNSNKKVQKIKRKKNITKKKKTNIYKNKRKIEITKINDSQNVEINEEVFVEGDITSEKLQNTSIGLPNEQVVIPENKLSNNKQTEDSSKSNVTFSSSSNNCNITVVHKNDQVSGRKRKNSSKENRFTYKKRKLRTKSNLSELPLQTELLCSDCGLTFDSVSSKDDHELDCKNIAFEMSIMADEKLFECPHCQLTFAKAGTHKKHTTSCRVNRSRKSNKLNSKVVKSDGKRNGDNVVSLLPKEEKIENYLSPVTAPDLNSIAENFKNYCVSNAAASQVCSLLYSCSLSTTELRTCLCDAISLDNSTIVQPKSDITSINKNNFSILKLVLDQPGCSELTDIFYKVMLSIKAKSYLKIKDLDKYFVNKSGIPPIVIESSRSDLLKTLSSIEDYLKEVEELETSVQKEEMLRNMKLAFEAGTRS